MNKKKDSLEEQNRIRRARVGHPIYVYDVYDIRSLFLHGCGRTHGGFRRDHYEHRYDLGCGDGSAGGDVVRSAGSEEGSAPSLHDPDCGSVRTATWLLFSDFGFGETGTKVYFVIVAIFFYTVQTLVDVPYTALSGEMTTDYDERSTLGSVRIVWALVGVIFGGGILYYTDVIGNVFGMEAKEAWSVAFAGFGLLCTVSIIVGWAATKGYENREAVTPEAFSFKLIASGPLRNKAFLHVAGAFVFGILAQAIFLGSMTYYLYYNLELNDAQVASVNTIMWIVGLAWVWPVNKLSQTFTKKVSWNFSFGLWLV